MQAKVTVAELTAFWRTASFRLTIVAAAGVSIAATFLVAVIYWHVNAALTRDLARQVQSEAIQLVRYARENSHDAFVRQIALRSRLDPRRLYGLTGSAGLLAGDLRRWPSAVDTLDEATVFRLPMEDGRQRLVVGIAHQIDDQRRLLVAREARAIADLSNQVFWWMLLGITAMTLSGVLLGFVMSRLVLGRIAAITLTAQRIMSGNLSERITLSGSADEFDGLACNLNHMLARIEELMAGIQEVSDNIAHDLKTPLNRLRNRAEEAIDGARNEREALEQILVEADDLIRTFNALLQIARLESGASDSAQETMDLSGLVKDIVEFYAPVAEESHATIVYEEIGLMAFHGNRQLLAQALINLIENALKYGVTRADGAGGGTSQGAQIRIRLARCGDHAALSVSDRGPGIPMSKHAHALRRFGRLDTSRSQPGTGLGLSLVRAVAKIHGGQLELADNQPGLIATIRLPLASSHIPSYRGA